MTQSEPPAFNWEVFLKLLESRGVTAKCPACGWTEWGHGDHLVGLQLADENRNLKPFGGIAVAPLACLNCGYLWMFVPAAIEGYGPTDGPDKIA